MHRILHMMALCLAICCSGCAQTVTGKGNLNPPVITTDSVFRLVRTIPGNYTYLNVDVLDNIFLITSGGQLKKISASGDSVAVFNDVKKFGNPSYIDVSNPLKVLVFYRNYATVVMLDRLLSQRNSINFRKLGIFSIKAVATAYDNNTWIFDEQEFKLKKIDESGNMLLESPDMRQQLDTVPMPQLIMDSDNLVYLYDEKKGFYIFDYYGAYRNRLAFTGWNNIAVSGNRLFGFSGETLYSYELKSLNLKAYPLPPSFRGYESIRAVNGKLYLLKKDALEIYSIN